MEDLIEELPVEVKALENFLLYIKFQNGEEKIYDMKEMLKFDYYKNLSEKEKIYFNSIPLSEFNSKIKEMK